MKCRNLEEHAAKLQSEIASLKSQLKTSKKRIHQLQMTEAQIPEMKADFDREKATYQSELSGLKRLLESTQAQLRREVELRHKAEHATIKAKQGTLHSLVCVCCLLYTSPSPRDATLSRMPSSA